MPNPSFHRPCVQRRARSVNSTVKQQPKEFLSMQMKFIMLGLSLSILVSACSNSDPAQSDKKSSEDAKKASYIALNQERIKVRLKDPESAQFRNVFVSNTSYISDDTPVICGEINAKNSFGGYTGFERFVSHGSVQLLETNMADGEMGKIWAQDCGR